jgi:hypothetical protein
MPSTMTRQGLVELLNNLISLLVTAREANERGDEATLMQCISLVNALSIRAQEVMGEAFSAKDWK